PGRADAPPWRAESAYATLTCAFDSRGATTATIAGGLGRIDLPAGFHHPRSFTLHRGDDAETVEVPYVGQGLRFPAIEAMRCLRAGLVESPLLPHAATLAVMTTMDEIRGQIGVSYPADAA
ncbi:MAG TPA: hypothetical protein VIR00_05365, partial [Micromonosporaceae bacterium]